MKDLKKLRQARAQKAQAGKTALDQLNVLLGKDTLSDTETAQLSTLETQVDALEAEVAGLDKEIAAEEKTARRASLFGATALGGPALATVVNDTDPARTAGFKSLAEFAVSVRNFQVSGINDPRFAAAATGFQQNQGAAGEGILVPTEWREQIWSLVFADNDLLEFL
jgi:HK97 family phage major capsid protein